jgi:hypothetical protein
MPSLPSVSHAITRVEAQNAHKDGPCICNITLHRVLAKEFTRSHDVYTSSVILTSSYAISLEESTFLWRLNVADYNKTY